MLAAMEIPLRKFRENTTNLEIVGIYLSLDLETKYSFLAIFHGISSSILSSRNGAAGNPLSSTPSPMAICPAGDPQAERKEKEQDQKLTSQIEMHPNKQEGEKDVTALYCY